MSDTATNSNAELILKLREQIEFYFGDANLQKDRFIKQLINADNEGYVDLEKIANFNKMRSMTSDIGLIVEAAKSSNLVQPDTTGKRIRRTKVVPIAKNVDSRTVYVEGFPPDSTHDTLKQFFSVCGKVNYVSIPRNKDQARTFKGFAFIEYEKEEEAVHAIKELNTVGNTDHNPAAPVGLRVIAKDTWDRLKDEFKELKAKQRNEHHGPPGRGSILHISNVATEILHPEIKAILKNYGKVAYLDMQENGEGYARFTTPEEAKSAVTKIIEQKLQIGGKEVSARIVDGEEEQKYWEKILAISEKKKCKKSSQPQSKKKALNTRRDRHLNDKQANKKQKVGKGDQKERGRKEPKISETKPKKHVFFNEEDGPATIK